ncbi:MAG TPA: PAS domain S-box protein [Streptosporangiaceae bacterium]|jgi:PAS domain S-box-containing protein
MACVNPDPLAAAAVESAPDAIVALDLRFRVILWNRAAERLFGWRADEITGREPAIVPDELMAEHHAVLERVAAGGDVSIATRRFRRDGSLVDVRISTGALRDSEGRLTGWISVLRPYEEDEAAQHHVAERARLVRRLTDVVADINTELDLPSLLDRIVVSLTELTGADAGGFTLIEGDRLRLVSLTGLPEHLRNDTADLETSLVGELQRSGKAVMLATGVTRSLDELIWSELSGLHTIALGLSYVQGRPYGALYALYSRRKVGHVELELLELLAGNAGVALSNAMAYADLKRQRAHERAVIDSSADGIAVLDDAGHVRQWNPAAGVLTGISAEDVMGKPLPFPLPGQDASVTHQLANGRWLEILVAGIPETGERVVDFRDVTKSKELDEAKDLFMATASHELRTPITVVQGFASTLVNRWEHLSDDDRHGAVATIAERAGSLGRLVEQLLLGSRAGTGQLSVTNAPFDLGKLIVGTSVAFRTLTDRHTLVVDVPDDLPDAYGDAMASDVVIGQLLENALKYAPDGGPITVTAWAEGSGHDAAIVVQVDDEGVGIAPGDHDRIFERFVQGEAGDRRRFGGIGLGLYIVRRLVRAQGGEITAESRVPRGTRMRMTLRTAASVSLDSEDNSRSGESAPDSF